MKRPASQNKRGEVLRMAFRVRKVFGTFEKRVPEAPSGVEKPSENSTQWNPSSEKNNLDVENSGKPTDLNVRIRTFTKAELKILLRL